MIEAANDVCEVHPIPSEAPSGVRPVDALRAGTLRIVSGFSQRASVAAERQEERAAEEARKDRAAALRRAEVDVMAYLGLTDVPLGVSAQGFDGTGASVHHGGDAEDPERGGALAMWDERAAAVRSHLALLDHRHRKAVDRNTAARRRWRRLDAPKRLTLHTAYGGTDPERPDVICGPTIVRAAWPDVWERLRDAFARRVEEVPVVEHGKSLWATGPDGLPRQIVVKMTASTELALVVQARAFKVSYAAKSGGSIGAPLLDTVQFLAAKVDQALARDLPSMRQVAAWRAEAERDLTAALEAWAA